MIPWLEEQAAASKKAASRLLQVSPHIFDALVVLVTDFLAIGHIGNVDTTKPHDSHITVLP
jgi:hypothetical protein